MRPTLYAILVAVVAMLIPVEAPGAEALGLIAPGPDVQLANPALSEPVVQKSIKIVIQSFGSPKRGDQNVVVTVTTGQPWVRCKLKLTYKDGDSDAPDDAITDANGQCQIGFNVPERKAAAGKAVALVTVLDRDNKKLGSKERSFTVK